MTQLLKNKEPKKILSEWGEITIEKNDAGGSSLLVEIHDGYHTPWTWNLKRKFDLAVDEGVGIIETKVYEDGFMRIVSDTTTRGFKKSIHQHTWYRYIGKKSFALHEESNISYTDSDSNHLDCGGKYEG